MSKALSPPTSTQWRRIQHAAEIHEATLRRLRAGKPVQSHVLRRVYEAAERLGYSIELPAYDARP